MWRGKDKKCLQNLWKLEGKEP